ncbi:hypothetical protein QBC41DRAFT_378393 [Cercophora samala]|uniref:Rab-GAP TBC domain-containing protein n=1 Tax=Cercophora samala TaxID=330535 RepID=A0AA40DIB9_9PEZI|nr:hypothetical protein QBC41DRAFT_378393 [Cercophora samala]
MAPQKIASVRHKSRPSARLAPFRDDSSLVALRYEQTKQAEPPIPLPPPRNPRRIHRPASTITSSSPSSPITINPPPVPPPQEEHPLFRTQSSPRSQADEWKRDSGLAPTSSSVTLREEGAEDPGFQKFLEVIDDAASVYSSEEQSRHKDASPTIDSFPTPPLRISIPPRRSESECAPQDNGIVSPTARTTAPASPVTPTRQTSLTKRIGQTLGLRSKSEGSKRLRKKMLGDDKAADASPEAGHGTPKRGVPGPLKSPKLPSSPATPAGAPVSRSSSNRGNIPATLGSSATTTTPTAPTTPANTGDSSFMPLDTPIPDDSLWDDLGDLSFSKRGSIMFGGKSDPFRMLKAAGATSSATASATATEKETATPLSSTTTKKTPDATTTATVSSDPPPTVTDSDTVTTTPEKTRSSTHTTTLSVPSIRVLPVDVERESQKVRSLYESSGEGCGLNWEDGGHVSSSSYGCGVGSNTSSVVDQHHQHRRLEPTVEVPSEEEETAAAVVSLPCPSSSSRVPSSAAGQQQPAQQQQVPSDRLSPRTTPASNTPRSASSLSPLRDSHASAAVTRREYERAGGIEDWEDVGFSDVDRYGFISQRLPARPETARTGTPELRSAQMQPRRRNVLTKRPMTAYSATGGGGGSLGGYIRPPSRKVSTRSLNTFTSEFSTLSRRSTRSSIRSATNRLPHNRDRRWMDEAGDMLALQAGLTGINTDDHGDGGGVGFSSNVGVNGGKNTEAQKRKELERAEKWRKMATVVNKKAGPSSSSSSGSQQPSSQGQGMDYEFDTKNAKLIDRTWKGIPDCWRAAAWYSFLATSARQWKSTETDEYLIAEFTRLQHESSPDDVQIDLDVPRTINGHIMFRKRYRGGQRLLFRVLHAISLFFPELGYVQGMAPLAATLLCYFDEERCFVMLVRMWRYRGLEHLYKPGFAELMGVLEDFENRWLAGKDVAAKLKELAIDATAYGTRWYLTLFNLSIPFPAQLRVWDVFMLLGECPPPNYEEQQQQLGEKEKGKGPGLGATGVPTGLDILHATSAALINALRDVLLDSDFENAMKALTAWIPIKDEDLLMKVTRAEWRVHHKEGGGASKWKM